MRNSVLIAFIIFGFMSTVRMANEEKIQFTKENGFVLYYPMPASDDDVCDINKVIWSQPFVKVILQDSEGGNNDAVVVSEHRSNKLWDIEPLTTKGARMGLTPEAMQKLMEKQNSDVAKQNDRIIDAIYFPQVKGYFYPDPELRQGVCRNFLGFSSRLVRFHYSAPVGPEQCQEVQETKD